MGKTEQRKQMEAIFVPRKGTNHIEFAGVVEASRDTNCDIHGNSRRASSQKRDSISFPISMPKQTADILKKRESVDRELGKHENGDNIYDTVQRRRSSSGKGDKDAAQR